mmetsp:Transcript_94789/g.244768  ORF Transcript_94789/g.244768 Transcript_94789/m.244768 type:complete len:219 (+) Transcript_94789:212-868(+)
MLQDQALPELLHEVLLARRGHEVPLAAALAEQLQRVLVEILHRQHVQRLHAGDDDADVVGVMQDVLARGLVVEGDQHPPAAHVLLGLVDQRLLLRVQQGLRSLGRGRWRRIAADAAGVRDEPREILGVVATRPVVQREHLPLLGEHHGVARVHDVVHVELVLDVLVLWSIDVVDLFRAPFLVGGPLDEQVVDDELAQLDPQLLPLLLHVVRHLLPALL